MKEVVIDWIHSERGPQCSELPMMIDPKPLGLRRSFGFGDRLGLATPGHIEAVRGSSFTPIFAQQSIREMQRTGRTPAAVMQCARDAIHANGIEPKICQSRCPRRAGRSRPETVREHPWNSS